MSTFEVAHIREQGVDLIVIPLKASFRHKTSREQNEVCASLQYAASDAGLAGTVVPVWDNGSRRMGFLAPQNFHPFFKSINMAVVAQNINKKLTIN